MIGEHKFNRAAPGAPGFYTNTEGGSWARWAHGRVPHAALEIVSGSGTAEINGEAVHSFAWGNPAAGFFNIARWDSRNGWTQTPDKVFW